MSDYDDERIARQIERAEIDLADLTERWIALDGMVAKDGQRAEGARRPVPGPTVPIRLDVVDLQRDIAAFVGEQVPLARGALRAGLSNGCSTVGGLGYLLSNISSIWREDPLTAEGIASGAGSLRWRARRIAGEVSAAFPIDVECPECGCMALWAHPGRGLIRCGMSECAGEWSAGTLAVSVWKVDDRPGQLHA